jgi:hypothetical protein
MVFISKEEENWSMLLHFKKGRKAWLIPIVNIYIIKDIQAKHSIEGMISNVCMLLVQIIVWLGVDWKVKIAREELWGTKKGCRESENLVAKGPSLSEESTCIES